MPGDDRSRLLERSIKAMQRTAQRSGAAASASYTLIGSIILLGGLGYGYDRWQGTAPWGVFVGLMFGVVVGFYQLARSVWTRK